MIAVQLLGLDQKGRDTLKYTIRWDGKGFHLEPDTPEGRRLFGQRVCGRDGQAVSIHENPEGWLKALRFHFKSPYLRATKPVRTADEDETTSAKE